MDGWPRKVSLCKMAREIPITGAGRMAPGPLCLPMIRIGPFRTSNVFIASKISKIHNHAQIPSI